MKNKSLLMAIITLIIAGTSCQKGIDDRIPEEPITTDTAKLQLSRLIVSLGAQKDTMDFECKNGKLFSLTFKSSPLSSYYYHTDIDSISYDDKGQVTRFISILNSQLLIARTENIVSYNGNTISIIHNHVDYDTSDTTDLIISDGKIAKKIFKYSEEVFEADYQYNNKGQITKYPLAVMDDIEYNVLDYHSEYNNPYATLGDQIFWSIITGVADSGEPKMVKTKKEIGSSGNLKYSCQITLVQTNDKNYPAKFTLKSEFPDNGSIYEFFYTGK